MSSRLSAQETQIVSFAAHGLSGATVRAPRRANRARLARAQPAKLHRSHRNRTVTGRRISPRISSGALGSEGAGRSVVVRDGFREFPGEPVHVDDLSARGDRVHKVR
jgi:hypothetical protein